MYATNLTDQLFSAALPLKPLVAWCGSACSVTVAVPPAAALAGLNIGSVGVTLSLPDGSNVAAQAVHVANTPLWTATFPASNFATSGTVAQGLMVMLAGADENGVVRTWIVAKGDLEVRDGDASPSPGGSWVAVKLREDAPENPVEGDAYVSDGELHIFAGGEWVVIGAPVTIDPSLSPTSENPVQNKAVAAALAAKLDGEAAYPAWDGTATYLQGDVVWYDGQAWISNVDIIPTEPPEVPGEGSAWEIYEGTIYGQIGGKQDALTSAQIAAVNSGATAAKVAAWDGYAAQIAQKANASDVNAALAQKANSDALSYAMVTPGEWEFSGSGYDPNSHVYSIQEIAPIDPGDPYTYELYIDESYVEDASEQTDVPAMEIVFEGVGITATRPSLPGHLLDRANNLIDATTGNVTLTLPPFVAGKVRDLLVACTIGLDANDDPWSVIFQGDDGEEISFKAEGKDASTATFPVPDAAGDWWYSLTERAPHVFAVSLKQLQSVSQQEV